MFRAGRRGRGKRNFFSQGCVFLSDKTFSRTTPSSLPLPLITQSWITLPAILDRSLAKGDCNCHDGPRPSMTQSWVLGTWLAEQNCGPVSYEEGDMLFGRQPTTFAQRGNTHRHLREAPYKSTALLASPPSLICKAHSP